VAEEALVKRLKESVKDWNEWRNANLKIWLDLSEADFREADLREADLRNLDLRNADLQKANLSDAKLDGSYLSGANLREADLSDAHLVMAYLDWSDLRDAGLNGADLRGVNLNGANLQGADLGEANLSRADCRWADFSGADLTEAQFNTMSLRWANLKGAQIGLTSFAEVDLRDVEGLDQVSHSAHSYISVDTVYESKGQIPVMFLRGVGVPDNFIEYMQSLAGTAFEFYSCFISYSKQDQEFADLLHADLQDNGVRCWFAPHDAKAGLKLHEQIDQAIRLHEKLLLILSSNSIASDWVKMEIKKAAKRQMQEKRDVLFPVSLVPFNTLRDWECWDGDLAKDLAAEIREYLIPDFSQWKHHNSYKTSFDKLLKDLRSGKTKV
jgi:hypothetical protein